MAVTGDTGNGTTVTLSSTGAIGHLYQEISGGSATLGSVDASHLGSSGDAEKLPQDLRENSDVTGTLIVKKDSGLPALGTVETLTLTYPKLVATNTAANTAGTGWISEMGKPGS